MGRLSLGLILGLTLTAGAATVKVGWRESGGGRSIQVLNLEEYTNAALNGEAGVFTSPAALEAQAITIRTFARANMGRHRAEGYDFCDTTHCQRLLRGPAPARVRAAVESTDGLILWVRGRPAEVFFHRNCGGRTEDAGAIWPGASRAWLPVQRDDACARLASRDWTARIALTELARTLVLGQLRSLRVNSRTLSGRVATLASDAGPIDAERLHLAVGRALGWNYLKSRLYDVHIEGGEAVFAGRGSGHGVGLCQDGAEARGRGGDSAAQILAFYFPGTKLGVNAQGFVWKELRGERIVLRAELPGRDVLIACERALLEAERRTGFAAQRDIRVVVYPTLDAYRDATGEPGFMAASTRGRTIRLQPVDRLESMNAMNSTLLHEMLHVLLEQNEGKPLPRWFLEGLVLTLGGEPLRPGPWNPDVERVLAAPRDQAQLRAAYAAAAGRVRRLIAEHGKTVVLGWVETGLPAALDGVNTVR
jgi:stage II sporulation protein D